MLQITAFGFDSAQILPPAPGIRVAGAELFDMVSLQSIAVFDHDTWGNGVDEFTRIEVQGPLQLWCIDGEVELLAGGFESLTLDGALLHAPTAALGRLVQGEWEFPLTGAHWPELAIESVPADPFSSSGGT